MKLRCRGRAGLRLAFRHLAQLAGLPLDAALDMTPETLIASIRERHFN